MSIFSDKKYINTGFIIALLILLAVNLMIYFNIRFHFEDEKVVTETLQTIQTAEMLYLKTTEASSNRRGYLITNNIEFMQEYYPALQQIDSLYSKLKTSTKNNKKQQLILDTLGQLLYSGKDLWEESLELQEKSLKDNKAQIEFTKKGKEVQDRIKSLISALKNEENQVWQNRLKEADETADYTITNLIIGNIIAFVLLIAGVVLLNRNINSRKQVELNLEESRKWLETTLESIGDAVIVSTKIGEILFMNKAAEQITGWKQVEAKGMLLEHVFNIINEESRIKPDSPLKKVLETGKVTGLANHTLLITKLGTEVPIDDSAAPLSDGQGGIEGVVLVFRDVSARRKAEKELLNSRKFIERIADSVPSIIYTYSLKGPKINYTNYKVSELLGYSSENVISMEEKFFTDLIHPDDMLSLRKLYEKYAGAKDNEILDYEYRIKNSKGEWRWFRNYDVVFSRDTDGTVKEMLGTATDVTEKKFMEEELKKYSDHLEELVGMRTSELQTANIKLKQEINERARAERSIIDAEEKFRSLVENSLVGIYIIQDDEYAYTNPKYDEIFGYKRGELFGRNIWDVVSESSLDIVRNNIKKRLSNEIESIQYTFKAVKKDGSLIDVEVKGSKMMYNGKVALIGTLQDITDIIKAEEEIRKSRQKLLLHAEHTPLGVIEWDLNFCVTSWNDAASRIFGFTKSEIMGKHASVIIPDEVKHLVDKVWKGLLSKTGGERSSNENITKSGKRILCEWYNTPLIDETNKVIGVASLVEDITERKKAEEELSRQKEYLRTVIDTDPNFVFAKDWEGRFTLVNKSVANTYGTTADGLIGKTDADFNMNPEEVEHFLKDDRDVISSGKSKFVPEEKVTNSNTGESRWYQTIKVPLKAADGSVQVLGVSADITARKLAEEITRKSLQEKELLLKKIHHRVKNNLQIIVSLLKLQSRYVKDAKDLSIFNSSRSRVETMSLIHEKLYKSKDISDIDLGGYLKDLVTHILKAYYVNPDEIQFKLKSEDIKLSIDTAIPCGLIINELINNTLKYAFPQGHKGKIEINIMKQDEDILLEIADNGIGIPASFDINSSDSLGLQLVDTLIRQISGTVRTDTSNGTKFTIKFREIKYRERI